MHSSDIYQSFNPTLNHPAGMFKSIWMRVGRGPGGLGWGIEMKYYVSSRSGNEELRKLFPMDIPYELSDSEVVGLIRQFGRASIDGCHLHFEDDYD
jgi:hypothetical protein